MALPLPTNPFAKTGILILLGAGILYAGILMNRPHPSEKDRIVTAMAYSIISPDGWTADIQRTSIESGSAGIAFRDGIVLGPDRYMGIPPKILVHRYASAPDLDKLRAGGWMDGLFEGEKAVVKENRHKRTFTRSAIFERSGQWFEMVLSLPDVEYVRSDQWWGFAQTFRYPEPGMTPPPDQPEATTTPSTSPTSAPSVTPVYKIQAPD